MKKLFLFFTLFIFASLNILAKDVKVLIVENKNNISITASGGFSIRERGSTKKYRVKTGGTFKVTRTGNTLKIGSVAAVKPVEITLDKESYDFTINGNKYNGMLIVQASTKTGVNIIERLDLEDYLYGVLPYEMSAGWPLEALKAQAVAARTYTLKTIEDRNLKDFDLYSDVRSQMYKGSVKKYDSVKKAVDGTKGEVLKYKSKLFYTYYHANCGGHTDEAAWQNDNPKPLQGAKCGHCGKSKNATWKYTVPEADINKFLKKQKIAGTIKSIKIADKYASGRAKSLQLTTTKTKKNVICNTFRLGVGSTKFKSCMITKINKLTFEGRGYGHGRGMCQDGAKGMAEAGKNYKDILERFYPASGIKKI